MRKPRLGQFSLGARPAWGGGEAGLRAAVEPRPCWETAAVGSSRGAAGHWGRGWGERKGKAWEAETGPRKFTFPLVSPRLFNLSPGVTGQAAAPLQRAVPRTVPGKEEEALSRDSATRTSRRHAAGGAPRTCRPPRGQGSGNDSPRGGSAPVAVSLACPQHPRSSPWPRRATCSSCLFCWDLILVG